MARKRGSAYNGGGVSVLQPASEVRARFGDLSGLRVGLVTPYDLSVAGGVNTHVLGLGRELQRRGATVFVAGPARYRDRLPDDLPIVPVGSSVPIPVAGSVANLAIDPRTGWAMRAVLREHPCDILHLHEPFVPMPSFAALLFSRAVNVGTFHLARERPHLLYLAASPLLRPLSRRLHGRIAVSTAALRTVSQFIPGRYELIPNGIELERFDAGPRTHMGPPTLLFVSRLEPRKGLMVLLRAMPEIRSRVPGVRLDVVGSGPLERRARRFAERLGVADAVRFRGPARECELPELYRSAAVFCAPATGNESFGLVLIEAMAAGTPVIAAANPGYRAVVHDGEDGLLVPPGDAGALAEAVCRLLLDPALWAKLSEGARATAKRYAWSRLADDVLRVYAEAAVRAGASFPALSAIHAKE